LSSFSYKQVIVVRSDIKMSKGKTAVQVAHAAVVAADYTRRKHRHWWREWLREGQRKIAVKASSEKELFKIEKDAKALKIPTCLVQDKGLTEIPPGTYTCLGIGPAPNHLVDKITEALPLL